MPISNVWIVDLIKLWVIFTIRFLKQMSEEINVFDYFVDDLLSEDSELLKGELDFLIMQHLFNSLDLDKLDDIYKDLENEYIAA